jgi:hypothetical protein
MLLLVGLVISDSSPGFASDAKELYLQMAGLMATQTNYRVEYRDLIRKRSYAFFQRTDPDGIQETANVRLDGEVEIDLRNRHGRWRVRDDAVKIEFGEPESPDLQELRKLVEQYPEEVTFTSLPGVVLADGTSCSRVEANLSPKLVSTLAGRLKAAWKAARDPRFKSGADPLESVRARRQYLIGQQDSLSYGTKTYDGNGDLVSEIAVSSYQLALSIPHEVFEVPEEIPVFIARSPAELATHNAMLGKRRGVKLWDSLVSELARVKQKQIPSLGKETQQKQTQ